MTPIKRKISYFFRQDTYLKIRIRWNGNVHVLSVGYRVDRSKWNENRCKPGTSHGPNKIPASVINKVLVNFEEKIGKAFYAFEMEDQIPTVDELKSVLAGEDRKGSLPTVEEAYGQFVIDKERYNQWSFNTVRTVRNIGNLLKKFHPNLAFRDINEGFLQDFVVWQQTHRISHHVFKTEQQGYSNPVIMKNCRIFKWFLEWSEQKGYLRRGIAADFKPSLKTVDKDVVFLEWDELLRLETLPVETAEEDEARDFFCFCCFSSLRYSDAHALKKSSVHENHINIVSKKTDKLLKIDLNSHSRRILNKYKDGDGVYALPRTTLPRLNVIVKRLGEKAGFDEPISVVQYYGGRKVERTLKKWELLSTHSGRRTFICNALAMGIPPHIVMKWTGHSDFASMKPYIGVTDKMKTNAMKLFDNDSNLESQDIKSDIKNTKS